MSFFELKRPKIVFSSALSIQPSFTDAQLEIAKTIRPRLKSEGNDLDEDVFFPEPVYMSSLGSPRKKSNDMQDVHLDSLREILEKLCKSYKKVGPTTKMLEECQHPASSANYWISKWVDYSDKFGFGEFSQTTSRASGKIRVGDTVGEFMSWVSNLVPNLSPQLRYSFVSNINVAKLT